jgi:hypothetical protein
MYKKWRKFYPNFENHVEKNQRFRVIIRFLNLLKVAFQIKYNFEFPKAFAFYAFTLKNFSQLCIILIFIWFMFNRIV